MSALSPYPFQDHDLPQVTRAEIIEAISIAPRIHPFFGGPALARITSTTVLKYGRHVQLCEARNMLFVREKTKIPVPAVIDAWEVEDRRADDEGNSTYILMQYIEGRLVSDMWDDLNVDKRHDLLRQLSGYIQALHSIKLNHPGPIGGGISDGPLFTDYGAGPFTSRQDIEKWYNGRLQVCHDFRQATHLESGSFSGDFDNLVMCHLDIHERNLILDNQGKLWLIDWETAGAYSVYFEFASNFCCGAPQDFKHELLDLVGGKSYQAQLRKLFDITFALTTAGYTQPRVKINT